MTIWMGGVGWVECGMRVMTGIILILATITAVGTVDKNTDDINTNLFNSHTTTSPSPSCRDGFDEYVLSSVKDCVIK